MSSSSGRVAFSDGTVGEDPPPRQTGGAGDCPDIRPKAKVGCRHLSRPYYGGFGRERSGAHGRVGAGQSDQPTRVIVEANTPTAMAETMTPQIDAPIARGMIIA